MENVTFSMKGEIMAIKTTLFLRTRSIVQRQPTEEKFMRYDSTGMFHLCEPVSIEDALIRHDDPDNAFLVHHILVCVHGESPESRLCKMGLRNFVIWWGF